MLKKLTATVAFAALATSATAQTFDAAAFYKGKNVTILVASSTGGGLDTYARLVGRHFQKHIPGAPTIVVQNMPGAGGNIVANHIFNTLRSYSRPTNEQLSNANSKPYEKTVPPDADLLNTK